MRISFQKQSGDTSLAVSFFWKLTIQTKSPTTVSDHFIPELFFDYLFVKEGGIKCIDKSQARKFTLPDQTLKTMYTHPLAFVFSTPLVMYGARLSLRFADLFWEEAQADRFLKQAWVKNETDDFESFILGLTQLIAE